MPPAPARSTAAKLFLHIAPENPIPLPYYFSFSCRNRQALFSRCGKINANFRLFITNARSRRCFAAHTAQEKALRARKNAPVRDTAYSPRRTIRNSLRAGKRKNRRRATLPSPRTFVRQEQLIMQFDFPSCRCTATIFLPSAYA